VSVIQPESRSSRAQSRDVPQADRQRVSTSLDTNGDRNGKALRFAGYAALFDRIDKGGDVIRKGAFARAVAAGAGALPLLWQHDATRPIGRVERIAEDSRGLRVIGRLSAGAGEAARLLADGALSGLSFGYRVRGGRPGAVGPWSRARREITDLDLVEVSLVTFPMQPAARVHAVAEDQ